MLVVENVSVAYGPVVAVRGVSLQVGAAEIVAVIGANGAGKTSLLHGIIGLVRKSSGRVIFDGQDVSRWPTERIVVSGMSLVSETRDLFGAMTCEENLRTASLGGDGRAEFLPRAAQVFALFPRLRDRLDQRAATLSGGEQQMLAVGRAMMQAPKLLILDEPSSGLAPKIAASLFESIEHVRVAGTAVLLVEQRARAAIELADRGYFLKHGQVAFSGSSQDLRDEGAVRELYFGA